MAIFHPQEIFLQKYYLSLEYVGRLRDAWAEYVAYIEKALAEFDAESGARQRSALNWDGSYVEWKKSLLPHFNSVLAKLRAVCLLIAQGDQNYYPFLVNGCGILQAIRFRAEFNDDWLTEDNLNIKNKMYSDFMPFADNIARTIDRQWREGELTYSYSQKSRGEFLNLPPRIQAYEKDQTVTFHAHSESVPKVGFYVSDVDHSSICFFHKKNIPLYSTYRYLNLQKYTHNDDYYWDSFEIVDTTWTFLRPIEGGFIDVPPEGFFPNRSPAELAGWADQTGQEKTNIAKAGDLCPKAGLWRALAPETVREFAQGEIFPELNRPGFAATYWFPGPDAGG